MAIMVPTGNATAKATVVVTTVPATSGRMPKCGLTGKFGVHIVSVRKLHKDTLRKNGTDSYNRISTIPVVTATDESAASNRPFSTTQSFQYRRPGPSMRFDASARASTREGAAPGAPG